MDSSDYYNFDASVGVSARNPLCVLYGSQMGLLCLVLISGDSDVESIEADVDCDFRDYNYHLQSDFPIPCDTGYVGNRQHSDYWVGCGFDLCLEIGAIVDRDDKEVSTLIASPLLEWMVTEEETLFFEFCENGWEGIPIPCRTQYDTCT